MSVICITLGGWACGSVPPKHRPPNLSCGTSAVALTAPSLSVTGMKPSGSVMTEGTRADCRERARHEGRGGGVKMQRGQRERLIKLPETSPPYQARWRDAQCSVLCKIK